MSARPRLSPSAQRTRHGVTRPQRGADRRLEKVAGNAVFLLLALAVLGLLASVASCAPGGSTIPGAGSGTPATTPTASPIGGDAWIPLRSQAPADILAAARSGPLFQANMGDSGGDARDLSRLGTPVLVQAVRPAGVTAEQVPDFYVIPVLEEAGAATDAIELALNPARTAVQEIAIITYAVPRAGGSIAQLAEDQAIQAVTSQRRVAVQANSHPYLVYFLLDPQPQETPSDLTAWMAGGMLPADPIWLVPAADGGRYFAGNDGNVYTSSQLPH